MENQLQWFEKIENVYRHLQDEESRVLFNARFYFLRIGRRIFLMLWAVIIMTGRMLMA